MPKQAKCRSRSLLRSLNDAAKFNDIPRALEIFEQLAGAQPDLLGRPAYHTLLSLLVSEPEASARVQQHMRERGVKPDETTVRH